MDFRNSIEKWSYKGEKEETLNSPENLNNLESNHDLLIKINKLKESLTESPVGETRGSFTYHFESGPVNYIIETKVIESQYRLQKLEVEQLEARFAEYYQGAEFFHDCTLEKGSSFGCDLLSGLYFDYYESIELVRKARKRLFKLRNRLKRATANYNARIQRNFFGVIKIISSASIDEDGLYKFSENHSVLVLPLIQSSNDTRKKRLLIGKN